MNANKNLTKSNTTAFEEISAIIERSRENAFRAVNREMITMYWEIGKHISERSKTVGWGKSVVAEFSNFVQLTYSGIKGFSPQNIWRMKQFYEAYAENEKLSPLVREINWTNNIIILSRALIAEYQTHLPQKALLTNKLRELRALAEAEGLGEYDE